jgi:large subunit ribosomal protein L32
MAPLPKRKISKGRRDRRRAHDFLEIPNLVQCSNCGEMRLSHRVCPSCGHFRGREVISIEKESNK